MQKITRFTRILLEIELVERSGVSRGRKFPAKSKVGILKFVRVQFREHRISPDEMRAGFVARGEIATLRPPPELILI